MPKIFQAYGIGSALIPVMPPPVPFENAPTSSQTNYEIGQIAFTPPTAPTAFYIYAGNGDWNELSASVGTLLAINGAANQLVASTVAGIATLSIPATFIAPGSITAAVGNITATNGNFVGSSANTGFSFPNAGTATGPAAAPVVLNARVGQVIFTTLSIAAGASLTLRITNSQILGATSQVLYSLSGATAGSALSIASITNSAGSSAIVVTNGTGATTNTANLQLNFLVLKS